MPSIVIENSTSLVPTRRLPRDPVSELRAAGIRVWVTHIRRYDVTGRCACEHYSEPFPCGGLTTVDLLDAEGNRLGSGEARCSPKDNYNRKLGFHIALGRALKRMRSHCSVVPEIGGSGG